MADISYDEVVKMAEQLPETDQKKLIDHLRNKQAEYKANNQLRGPGVDTYRNPTRADLISELKELQAAGALTDAESLYGKYTNPNIPEISAEEFHAGLHEIATEWEQELDEFDPNKY